MGSYRHQYWVIARINGRYRTLAVVNVRNCGDTDAIHGCWRLLQTFGSEKNRTLLCRDLEHAARQEPDWWESTTASTEQADRSDKAADRWWEPFPFVQTCLFLGAAFDARLEPYPYVYPVSLHRRNLTPMDFLIRNLSGCTVVDITNLQRLRYCFMLYPSRIHDPVMRRIIEEEQDYSWATPEQQEEFAEQKREEAELEKRCELLRCRPLTPEMYLTWPRLEKNTFEPYVDMHHWDLITLDTLHDLWPRLPWPGQDNSSSLLMGDNQGTNLSIQEAGNVSDGTVLLQHIFQRETLDFSPFPWLTELAVSKLLDTLASANNGGIQQQAITRVDLSGNRSIGPALVARLLTLCPNITTLTLLHTSSSNLPLQSLLEVLAYKERIIELHHSELFSAAFDYSSYEEASNDNTPRKEPFSTLPNYHPAVRTVDRVVFLSIIMQDGIPKRHSRATRNSDQNNNPYPNPQALRLPGGGLRWSHFLSKDEFSYLNRDSPFAHINIPLQDAFLDPRRLSDWLPRLLWYFATNSATNDFRTLRGGHASVGCACALAMDTEDDWRVSPIPATAAIRGLTQGIDEQPRDLPPIVPATTGGRGGWTLLIVSEDGPESSWYTRRCDALRYAFVTHVAGKDAEDGLVACGPADFYTRAMGAQQQQPSSGDKWSEEGHFVVPEHIQHLVKECALDEVQEIVGPFMQKRTQLLEAADSRN